MYEPKIFGLHIFCSISLRLREPVMVCSSFCSISPCPTAATHTSLSNYLGQQHQIIPTEIILRGPKLLSHRAWAWLVARMWTNAMWILGRQREEKWLSQVRAKTQLISLEDQNSIKCAISDAVQGRRPGLSIITLSAQIRRHSHSSNWQDTEY